MSDMPSSGWQYQESLFHSGEHAGQERLGMGEKLEARVRQAIYSI
jgi:hypothetical protein